jgi:hypothetical protein
MNFSVLTGDDSTPWSSSLSCYLSFNTELGWIRSKSVEALLECLCSSINDWLF